jgi:hypothetical protein
MEGNLSKEKSVHVTDNTEPEEENVKDVLIKDAEETLECARKKKEVETVVYME